MTQIVKKAERFQLTGGDVSLLKMAGSLLDPVLDQILEDFYKRALADPTTSSYFESEARLGFARRAQKKHWQRLLSGEFGSDYAESVDRIGRTHARINLPLEIYMSSYAVAAGQLLSHLVKFCSGGFFQRGRDAAALVDVVSRAFAFDIEQVTSTTFSVWNEEQQLAFDYLSLAIDALSEGVLTHRIPSSKESDFPSNYDTVRRKMNSASANLEATISKVTMSLDQMFAMVEEVSVSAEQLSHRTKNQATSLEETAAAMQQITQSVQQSAENTQKSSEVSGGAKDEIDHSTAVVEQTSNAMNKIKKSSEKISQITNLIDDIAFQTNLLALNAGVEAARAGDAGRGFAVVASEVRNLASRSSEAAKNIKALIDDSSKQVENGAALVDQAKSSLGEVVSSFATVADLSEQISLAIREQSTGLSEVNATVTVLDGITQENAAMAEDTNDRMTQVSERAAAVKRALAGLKAGQTGDGISEQLSGNVPNTIGSDLEVTENPRSSEFAA